MPASSSVSPREQEVLELVVSGLSNPEIARSLYITESTVKKHVASLLAKTSTANRTELMRRTLEQRIEDAAAS